MSNKTIGNLSVLAALLVLFSALIDPRITVVVSVGALLALGISQRRRLA